MNGRKIDRIVLSCLGPAIIVFSMILAISTSFLFRFLDQLVTSEPMPFWTFFWLLSFLFAFFLVVAAGIALAPVFLKFLLCGKGPCELAEEQEKIQPLPPVDEPAS